MGLLSKAVRIHVMGVWLIHPTANHLPSKKVREESLRLKKIIDLCGVI